MNDGMYTNIRNYLEELANQGKQIIANQERTIDLLNEIRLAANRTDGRAKEIVNAVETVAPPSEAKPKTGKKGK